MSLRNKSQVNLFNVHNLLFAEKRIREFFASKVPPTYHILGDHNLCPHSENWKCQPPLELQRCPEEC